MSDRKRKAYPSLTGKDNSLYSYIWIYSLNACGGHFSLCQKQGRGSISKRGGEGLFTICESPSWMSKGRVSPPLWKKNWKLSIWQKVPLLCAISFKCSVNSLSILYLYYLFIIFEKVGGLVGYVPLPKSEGTRPPWSTPMVRRGKRGKRLFYVPVKEPPTILSQY